MSWGASYRATIRQLSTPSLQGEILRLENSIKHLRRSNEELREHGNSNREDDASWIFSIISENEELITKQAEQIELVKQQLVERQATGERVDYLEMQMNEVETQAAKGNGAHDVESERNHGGEQMDLEESNDGVHL